MHSILSDKRTAVHIHVSDVAYGSLVIHLIKCHVHKYEKLYIILRYLMELTPLYFSNNF